MTTTGARALALSAAVAGLTAFAVPSPSLAAGASYRGDYCDTDGVPDFRARFSPAVVAPGQPTLYTLRIRDDWNHVEAGFWYGTGALDAGVPPFRSATIHHAETQVIRFIIRPTEDTTITWSGAIFCGPEQHYDMAPDLSPVTVKVVQP